MPAVERDRDGNHVGSAGGIHVDPQHIVAAEAEDVQLGYVAVGHGGQRQGGRGGGQPGQIVPSGTDNLEHVLAVANDAQVAYVRRMHAEHVRAPGGHAGVQLDSARKVTKLHGFATIDLHPGTVQQGGAVHVPDVLG